MCPSAPRVCSEPGGQRLVLSLSLDLIRWVMRARYGMSAVSSMTGLCSLFVIVVLYLCYNGPGNNENPTIHLFYITSSFVHHLKPLSAFKLELLSGKRSIQVKISNFFVPCDLEIWWITLKNDRAPLLCYIKLCASFQSHQWIQTGVTVQKRSIWVKIGDFFVLCDLEIWWMTLKNNRAPLLCCFKLCASFYSHWWIQTKVTVRKCSIRVKIGDFLSRVTLKFDGWHWKTVGHLFYATSSFVHNFVAIGE